MGLILLLAIIFVIGLIKNNRSKEGVSSKEVKLTIWGLYEDPLVVDELIRRYRETNPKVTIEYIQKDPKTYEDEINNALAENRAPDIWQIRNDALVRHKDKLIPAPSTLTLEKFSQSFPAIVSEDLWWPRPPVDDSSAPYKVDPNSVSKETKIYGLPWSVDTLALFYNRDLLSRAGITVPPSNWEEVIEAVKKLKSVDKKVVKQSGIALGLGLNVKEAADIISLLFMQNHAEMVSPNNKSALFNGAIQSSSGSLVPAGSQALDFYTSFARPDKENYNWNQEQSNSVQSFADGKTAMIIDYSFQINTIRKLSPALPFSVAPVPQVKGSSTPVNFGFYYANVVSRTSKNPETAWDFLVFTTNQDNMKIYFQGSKNPPALSALIDELENYPLYGPFIKQTKTAKSFYKGDNPTRIDRIMAEMADNIVIKGEPLQVSIDQAAKAVTDALSGGE